MKVLANDGLTQSGIDALKENGFEVITDKVAQENLITYINENQVVQKPKKMKPLLLNVKKEFKLFLMPLKKSASVLRKISTTALVSK